MGDAGTNTLVKIIRNRYQVCTGALLRADFMLRTLFVLHSPILETREPRPGIPSVSSSCMSQFQSYSSFDPRRVLRFQIAVKEEHFLRPTMVFLTAQHQQLHRWNTIQPFVFHDNCCRPWKLSIGLHFSVSSKSAGLWVRHTE